MTPEEREELMKQGLPAWVSDEQAELLPIHHWQDQDQIMKSQTQFRPVTFEQALAQANRIQAASEAASEAAMSSK